MSDELKVVWDLVSCPYSDRARVAQRLATGWEPFAVTVEPEGLREHQCEGHVTYFTHVVWFKRLKTS